MHLLVGLAGLVAILAYTVKEGHSAAFTGLFYPPAIALLVVAPLCVGVMSYRFEELRECLGALGKALRFNGARSRSRLYDDLARFGAEVRARRPAEAIAAAENASHPLVRQLAPLVVKQYDGSSIEATASTAALCQASALRRSEDVLLTLSRVAPATGLVGTVLGLITLLKDLSKFDQLGPSMALALLCTLYGLLLANGIYQPLARLVHSYAIATHEEARLLARALVLVGEGKPMGDVRALFEAAPAAGAEPVAAAGAAHG